MPAHHRERRLAVLDRVFGFADCAAAGSVVAAPSSAAVVINRVRNGPRMPGSPVGGLGGPAQCTKAGAGLFAAAAVTVDCGYLRLPEPSASAANLAGDEPDE